MWYTEKMFELWEFILLFEWSLEVEDGPFMTGLELDLLFVSARLVALMKSYCFVEFDLFSNLTYCTWSVCVRLVCYA